MLHIVVYTWHVYRSDNAKTDYWFSTVRLHRRTLGHKSPNDYSIIGFLVFVFSRRRATRNPENL